MRKNSILILSVATNVALVAFVFLRPSGATSSASLSVPALGKNSSTSTTPVPFTSAQLSALNSFDLTQLNAAGVPEHAANILAAGRAYEKMLALDRAATTKRNAARQAWWSSRGDAPDDEAQTALRHAVDEELNTALERAFPEHVAFEAASHSPHASLPAKAREKIDRIEKDYAELENGLNSRVAFPSDQARRELLQQEKQRDIAAALSPAELEQFQLRESGTAERIRSTIGDAIPSEDDYRKIFRLQQAYEDRFGPSDESLPRNASPETIAARTAANAQLQAEIRATVGEEKYAALERAHDQNYMDLTAISQRLQLPANTPDLVYTLRDRYAAQSQAINQNAALTTSERRAELVALAQNAQTELQTHLGTEGAAVYADHALWVQHMRGGAAFSTDPKDVTPTSRLGETVYFLPVPKK